jgi:hypothetical protein
VSAKNNSTEQDGCPLEFGDCDEEMTNDHNTPCEDVLRNALMNQIGGLSATRKVSGFHAAD